MPRSTTESEESGGHRHHSRSSKKSKRGKHRTSRERSRDRSRHHRSRSSSHERRSRRSTRHRRSPTSSSSSDRDRKSHLKRQEARSGRSQSPKAVLMMSETIKMDLTLASEADRPAAIEYIQGATFQQSSFISSRRMPTAVVGSGKSASSSAGEKSSALAMLYEQRMSEKHHDEAIFGTRSGPDAGQNKSDERTAAVPPSVGQVLAEFCTMPKEVLHPRLLLKSEDEWPKWMLRLEELHANIFPNVA